MNPLNSRETKTCPQCGKTYLIKVGFYRRGDDKGYRYMCKNCDQVRNKENEHKRKNYTFENHFWTNANEENIQECKRCGVVSKRHPHEWKIGHYKREYLVKGRWTKEKQICKKKVK